jgi:outer membrane cobalamin receptor
MFLNRTFCFKKTQLIASLLMLPVFSFAQSQLDSIQHLEEIVVTANRYKEIIPAQTLKGEELEKLNSFSVADAIRFFSGVQILVFSTI